MAKGAAHRAADQYGAEGAFRDQYNKQNLADRSTIEPFLTNELTNPQGYGADTIAQMLTQGGQAVSGATGAASEAAGLNASRTGNSAAVPGIIDATARNAMKQQSDNALNVNINNAMLKQKQQQAGAAGLENMYGEDQNAVLKSMGLQNESLGQWTNADKATQDALQGWEKAAQQVAVTGAMIAG